eukprot:m.221311 g.221311  ORF g.221311 m.221311 type:complete len:189 (-) comp54163_c0_seq18:48-614(-)
MCTPAFAFSSSFYFSSLLCLRCVLSVLQHHSTALMYAAYHGNTASVLLLLRAGADIALQNENGTTALDFARQSSQRDTVAVLEEHERFLAQLGSHTKRALREPVLQVQEEEADAGERAHNLLLDDKPSGVEDHFIVACDELDGPEHTDAGLRAAVTDSDGNVHERPREAVAGPVMNLGLTELDLDWPQ